MVQGIASKIPWKKKSGEKKLRSANKKCAPDTKHLRSKKGLGLRKRNAASWGGMRLLAGGATFESSRVSYRERRKGTWEQLHGGTQRTRARPKGRGFLGLIMA